MKISQSSVGMSSSHMLEQEERRQESASSKATLAGIRSARRNGMVSGTRTRLSLVGDRVSISRAVVRETSTEYSHFLSSQSSVRGAGENGAADFSRQEMVEKLVSTVVNEQVSSLRLTPPGPVRQSGTRSLFGGLAATATATIALDRTTSHFEQEQMAFSSRGQVLTDDGRAINFSLELAMDRTRLTETREQALVSTWHGEMALIDPLIINLEGGVPALGDTRFTFDLDNDGTDEEISFAASGSGFLSFDRNNDGVINNGSELFGPGTGNGFEELAVHDLDGNGWIDENDDVFSKLSVWTRDPAGNDRLVSLADAGIGAIYLDNTATGFELTDADNALTGDVARSGLFLFENGNVGMVQQIDLAARSPEQETVAESGSRADLSGIINTGRTVSGKPETEFPLPVKQRWQTEAKTLLEEMRRQILEMEKQIRRIFNLKPKPAKRPGNANPLFNRIRLPGKGPARRTGQVF